MTGSEILRKIQQLHQDSITILEEEQDFPAFWEQFADLFHEILESSAILACIISNLDAFQRAVTAIQASLEQEYQANLALKQALLRRQGEDDTAHTTAITLGLVSGDLLDYSFHRLTILAELIGLLDGSLTFPEETLETYYEIMGRIFPSQHLDA